MYKMVVSEFSNTLIDSEEAIPHSTMIEIDRLRRDNIIYTISSDDPFYMINEYNKDFPFIDYIIGYNGGIIYDCLSKNIIYSKSISNSIVKKIYKLFNNKNLVFYTLDYGYYLGNYSNFDYSKKIDNFNDFFSSNDIYRIDIVCDKIKSCEEVVKVLEEIGVSTYIVKKNNLVIVEVYNRLNNKISCIKKLCKLNKIKLDEVIGIVCNESDCCIVDNIGKCVPVKNACCSLKKMCKEKTLSNEEKGEEQVLKKYF